MLLMTGATASMYILIFYMPTYLIHSLHMPPVTAFLTACVAGATMLVMSPLFGLIADRLPTRKPMLYVASAVSLSCTYPGFVLLSSGAGLALTMGLIALGVTIMAVSNGAGAALLMEAFPRQHRATGMSVMYSLGVTVFGGFAPLVVTWLLGVTGNPMAPAWYLLASSAISLGALTLFPTYPGRD
jgi:MHS family proline/betaine transporter-like MFS transporter